MLTEEISLLPTVAVGFRDGLSIYVSLVVCVYADFYFFFFFFYELTLRPGKFWCFGLESRKLQKDKAHTLPLLHPSTTSI